VSVHDPERKSGGESIVMAEYAEWESFYIIIGAAAGALIGLQFVVLTLIAERPPPRAAEASATFVAPTLVHFGAALLLSALLRVPWHTIMPAAVSWGLTGLAGSVYAAIVVRRMRQQTAYKPDLDDWVFFGWLPLAAYVVLGLSAFAAPSHTHEALLVAGAASLLLLFLAIRNAWDGVAYHVFVNVVPRRAQDKD
jgi:hypothetical protein